jgi:ribonuclease P protein component
MGRLSVHRENTLRGREAIAWFFANKRNLRLPQGSVLRAAWARKDGSPAPGITFLIAVSKRTAKRAHDRNQLKRWIRAAIAETPEWYELEQALKASNTQLFLLFSPLGPPSAAVNWGSIQNAVKSAALIQHSKFSIQHSQPQE